MKLFLGLLLAIFSCFALIGAEKSAFCLQKHSKNGDGLRACLGFMPSWSYNSEENKCVEFVYGGCGGNDNRFGSQMECEKACKN